MIKSEPSRRNVINKHRQGLAHKSGFTLIELVVVIVVIAILASISVMAYNGIQKRAQTIAYTSTFDQVEKLLQIAILNEPSLPKDILNILGDSGPAGGGHETCIATEGSLPATAGFESGQCITGPGGYSVSNDNAVTQRIRQAAPDLKVGQLPITTLSIQGQGVFKSRGITLAATQSQNTAILRIQWYTPDWSSCGRAFNMAASAPDPEGAEAFQDLLGGANLCYHDIVP